VQSVEAAVATTCGQRSSQRYVCCSIKHAACQQLCKAHNMEHALGIYVTTEQLRRTAASYEQEVQLLHSCNSVPGSWLPVRAQHLTLWHGLRQCCAGSSLLEQPYSLFDESDWPGVSLAAARCWCVEHMHALFMP
jgi:hypothetical protein